MDISDDFILENLRVNVQIFKNRKNYFLLSNIRVKTTYRMRIIYN